MLRVVASNEWLRGPLMALLFESWKGEIPTTDLTVLIRNDLTRLSVFLLVLLADPPDIACTPTQLSLSDRTLI